MTLPDKDILFLLPPGFEANDRREFCPECAETWGLLSYYPAIKDALEIVHVGIDHPRAPITALLGEGRYNAPTLILPSEQAVPDELRVKEANGYRYLDSLRSIAALWAARYGIPARRGD